MYEIMGTAQLYLFNINTSMVEFYGSKNGVLFIIISKSL